MHALAPAIAAGRHLRQEHLDPDADFFGAGGSSVHAVELVAGLERDHGVELNLDVVFADAQPVSWPGAGHRPRAG
ncbi:acyl carrier protein [Streptomyces sp. NPDC052016]|uniref:acyl carrier protein n=1 Tax=Streptomyces sp. NPDC052016 TaxID=3365680 RepID=UPI0037D40567